MRPPDSSKNQCFMCAFSSVEKFSFRYKKCVIPLLLWQRRYLCFTNNFSFLCKEIKLGQETFCKPHEKYYCTALTGLIFLNKKQIYYAKENDKRNDRLKSLNTVFKCIMSLRGHCFLTREFPPIEIKFNVNRLCGQIMSGNLLNWRFFCSCDRGMDSPKNSIFILSI